MRTFIFVISVVAAAALGLSTGLADDFMVIHSSNGERDTFNLADIDSITFTQSDVREGLIAYYPFNGNANDESGNGLHGTVHGAGLTRDRHGNANSAYHFTRANQNYISVADNDLLDMHQGEGLTVMLWIKTEFNAGQTLCAKYNSVGRGGWHFSQRESGYGYFAGRAPGEYVYNDTTIVAINDGRWHMVVGMIDGRTWSNYVDGEFQRSVQGPANPSMNNSDPLVIGAHIDVGQINEYFNGDIDDVRIYNRALTEEEIQILYRQ